MTKSINLIVQPEEKGLRVDVFINKRENLVSRTRIKNLILKGNLNINSKIVKDPSKKIALKDKIILKIPPPKETSIKPYNFKLDIVYEDKNLLVINKPAGIIMHPGAGNHDNTIVNAFAIINVPSCGVLNSGIYITL